MQRSTSLLLTLGIIASVAVVGASVSQGASSANQCWDEYDAQGTRLLRTVTSRGVAPNDCTPGEGCLDGYRVSDGRKNRLYVPHGASPATACDDILPSTTTIAPVTTTAPATTITPSDPSTGRFATLPVGAALPSDATCAAAVRSMAENRPGNAKANATMGTQPNGRYPRVTGAFTGTTDELIQWSACKWGIDEDIVRAQIVVESTWNQGALGDYTSNADACAPTFPLGSTAGRPNECPESIGLGQVRWLYHQEAFQDNNAIRSSAYNLDYTYAHFRSCFEGEMGWLNTVDGRGDYAAGDLEGCLGVWFSGRWHTSAAEEYITKVNATIAETTWQQSWFPPVTATPGSPSIAPPTVAPTTTVTSTTTAVPPTAAPTTTVAPAATTTTTVAPAATTTTTVAPAATTTTTTTVAPAATTTTTVAPPTTTAPRSTSGGFTESFTGNTGLDRFRTGVYHRDDVLVTDRSWQGDHDLACNAPPTTRIVHRDDPSESFYTCKDHLMTSVGDTSGYSVAWFSPKQTFGEVNEVCWSINLTDLGSRKWFKVAVLSVNAPDIMSEVGASELSGIEGSDRAVASWGGVGGYLGKLRIGESRMDWWGMTAGSDKKTRYPACFRDNGNGTLTFTMTGPKDGGAVKTESFTVNGRFPTGPKKVVFQDHSYTPSKPDNGVGGTPIGYTHHWDDISIS